MGPKVIYDPIHGGWLPKDRAKSYHFVRQKAGLERGGVAKARLKSKAFSLNAVQYVENKVINIFRHF